MSGKHQIAHKLRGFPFCIKTLLCVQLVLIGASGSASQNKTPASLLELFSENGRWYLKLMKPALNREFLVLGRIIKTEGKIPCNQLRGSCYPGSKLIENVIKFSLQGDTCLKISLQTYATNIHASGLRTFDVGPFYLSNIVQEKDGNSITTDITSLLLSDNEVLWMSKSKRISLLNEDSIATEKNVKYVHWFKNSTEIGLEIKYNKKSIFANISFILLPEIPLSVRVSTPYVNYFYQPLSDKTNPGKAESGKAILRWRIEPPKDKIKDFLSGKLVTPKKQIVFILDKKIPAKWLPYFKQGVLDWNKAFEKLGFKNTLVAKESGDLSKDSNYLQFYSFHSAIHYIESNIEDATYSTAVDPRSGEILQSHILWSSGYEQTMRKAYFAQVSLIDKRARKKHLDDHLLGTLIQRVITHEVGHALGFDHNMFASGCTPVNNYRSSKWLNTNGLTPSIMDYARYNYIARYSDNINNDKGRIWSIGKYDEWAIKWGYSFFEAGKKNSEQQTLDAIIAERNSSRELFYISTEGEDARMIAESLGDNRIRASEYGIKNLEQIYKQLPKWELQFHYDSSEKKERLTALIEQYYTYLSHVIVSIGGKIYTITATGQNQFTLTSSKELSLSLTFLNKYFLSVPRWLYDSNQTTLDSSFAENTIKDLQKKIIPLLLSNNRIITLAGGADTTQLPLFLEYLRNSIITTNPTNLSNPSLNKNLQSLFVTRIIRLKSLLNYNKQISDYLTDEIKNIQISLEALKNNAENLENKSHYEILLTSLKER